MTRRWGWMVLSAALVLAGCKSNSTTAAQPSQPGQTQAADGTQGAPAAGSGTSDGATGTASGSAANGGMAQNAAPVPAAAPAAAPAPAGPPALVAGTRIRVRLGQTLTTRDVAQGQTFSGTLAAPVVVGGVTAYRGGDRVSGVVTESKSPGKFKGEGVLSIRLTSVAGTPVRTEPFTQAVKGKGKRTAGFIGGGTGLGAVLGGIAGGGRGAAIGAVAGAGAGTAGGAMTGNKEVELPAEAVITFRVVR